MSYRREVKFGVRSVPAFSARVELCMWVAEWRDGVRSIQVAEKLTLRPLTEEEQMMEVVPLISLGQQEAQALADALWDAGVRPAGAAGSAGQLAAVQAHLHDLRALVFKGEVRP